MDKKCRSDWKLIHHSKGFAMSSEFEKTCRSDWKLIPPSIGKPSVSSQPQRVAVIKN